MSIESISHQMEIGTNTLSDVNKAGTRFVVKRSELTTEKLFVEFYLPEYQQLLSQLSQSPYSLRPLRKVCTRMFDGPFGSNRKVDMYQESGIPFVRVKDVLPGEIEQCDLTYISKEKHNELARSKVVPNNILLTIAGRVGTAAVFPDELVEGNITGHIVGLEVPEDINPHYLALFLNSRFGEFQLTRLAHRTTRPELNLKEVGQVLVSIPPRPIQDRIAQIMQDAYAERRAKLAEAQSLLEGIDGFVLGELGIDSAVVENHSRTIKSIKEIKGGRFDFEAVVTLREMNFNANKPVLLNSIVKQVNDRITPAQDNANESVNFIGLGNIASNTGQLVDFSPMPGSQILSSSPKFTCGDILFGRMRPYLNKVWIAEFDGVCSGEAIVLRPDKSKVDTLFLQSLLLSSLTLKQVVPLQSGTSLPRVSASDVLSIKLPIAKNLDKQIAISNEIRQRRTHAKNLLSEADATVAEAKRQVERMILGKNIGE